MQGGSKAPKVGIQLSTIFDMP